MFGRGNVVVLPVQAAPAPPVDLTEITEQVAEIRAQLADLHELVRRNLRIGNGGVADDVAYLRGIAERQRVPSGTRGRPW